jgi:Protein of unknown function (DUF1810)
MTEPDLVRFVTAQDAVYPQVAEELSNGRKRTHWMLVHFSADRRTRAEPNGATPRHTRFKPNGISLILFLANAGLRAETKAPKPPWKSS